MVEPSELAVAPVFSQLDPADLADLARGADRLEIPEAGVEVARSGDFGHAVLVIADGTADVIVDGETVRQLGSGDLFGEVAVLASGRRTATVISTSPMRLITLFKSAVWELERRQPAIRDALRSLYVDR